MLYRAHNWKVSEMRVHRRLSSRIVATLAIILAVLALTAVACGSEPATTSVTTASTAAEPQMSTYTDPVYGFSFDYPSDWKIATGDSTGINAGSAAEASVQAGDPNGAVVNGTGLDGVAVNVYELKQAVDESMLPQVKPQLEAAVADLVSQDASWKIVQPLTEAEDTPLPGFWAAFTFDWDADHPVDTLSYYLFEGAIEYQLMFQASVENWDANQAIFETILASFNPGEARR
jgi:hypothetical protein